MPVRPPPRVAGSGHINERAAFKQSTFGCNAKLLQAALNANGMRLFNQHGVAVDHTVQQGNKLVSIKHGCRETPILVGNPSQFDALGV